MAVIVQYIVVRDGVQKMTFATKKEADAYDKMLDIAENLYEFIETSEIEFSEKQLEDLTYFLAENKDKVGMILKGGSPKPASAPKKTAKPAKDTKDAKAGDKPSK